VIRQLSTLDHLRGDRKEAIQTKTPERSNYTAA
jgi:hypothetical protein